MNQPRVEFYKGRDGRWFWRFRAANGRIVADGSQGYTRLENAQKGWYSMMRSAMSVRSRAKVIEP